MRKILKSSGRFFRKILMDKKAVNILSVFIFLFFILFTGSLSADTDISIYYTASLNGNLIGCECKGVPKAGLSVTAAYLREIDPKNSIVLDLGDFNDARTDKLLANTLVDLYVDLGYRVASLGDQELASGVDFFYEISNKLDFICNNITVDGNPVSSGPLIIEKEGIKIGIAAVIDPDVFYFYPDDVKSRVDVADPDQAASDMLEALADQGADCSILLFHGGLDKAKKIYAAQTGWDAVLSAHDQTLFEQQDGKRVLASPGEEGNRVGKLTLSFRFKKLRSIENSMRYFKYEKDPEDPEVLQAFEDYKKELIENLRNGKN